MVGPTTLFIIQAQSTSSTSCATQQHKSTRLNSLLQYSVQSHFFERFPSPHSPRRTLLWPSNYRQCPTGKGGLPDTRRSESKNRPWGQVSYMKLHFTNNTSSTNALWLGVLGSDLQPTRYTHCSFNLRVQSLPEAKGAPVKLIETSLLKRLLVQHIFEFLGHVGCVDIHLPLEKVGVLLSTSWCTFHSLFANTCATMEGVWYV